AQSTTLSAQCSRSTTITRITTAHRGREQRDLGRSDTPNQAPETGLTPPHAGFFIFTAVCMDYSKLDGLIPAVIQDAETSEVLMVGFMNDVALAETRRTGFATF